MSLSFIMSKAQYWDYDWKAINEEIQLKERKIQKKTFKDYPFSELDFMRSRAELPTKVWIEKNDTLYSIEYVYWYGFRIETWKNSEYNQIYWSASYYPHDSVIIVEKNPIEYNELCPCDKRRFLLCKNFDIDALNSESEKQKGSTISENSTLYTFVVRVIFEDKGKYKIDVIKFEGYDGMF